MNAITMRKDGFSLKEIAKKLDIAQSTASLWLRSVALNDKAKSRLLSRQIENREKIISLKKLKMLQKEKDLRKKAQSVLNKIEMNPSLKKLLCAFLYWGEGSKAGSFVTFTNSDSSMIETFLKLFRSSFRLDEKKFRGLVHVHEYHDEVEVVKFWSKTTNISINQFSKSYKKPNTGKIKRVGYQGTLRIRYYDAQIARELKCLYNTAAEVLINK